MNTEDRTNACRPSSKTSLKYTERESMMVVEYFLKYRGYLTGEQSKNISPKKKEYIWQFITSKLNEGQPVKRQWHQTRKRISDIKHSIRFKNIEGKKDANKCDPNKLLQVKYTPSEERISAIMTKEEWHGETDTPPLMRSQLTGPALHVQDPVLLALHAVENEESSYDDDDEVLEETIPFLEEEDHVKHKHYEENVYEQPGAPHGDVHVLNPGFSTQPQPQPQPQRYTNLVHEGDKNVLPSAHALGCFATGESSNDDVHTIQRPLAKRVLESPTLEEAKPYHVIIFPYYPDESHGPTSRAYETLRNQPSPNADIGCTSVKDITGIQKTGEAKPFLNVASPAVSDHSVGTPSRDFEPLLTHANISPTSTKGPMGSPTVLGAASDPNIVSPSSSKDCDGNPSRGYDAPVTPSSQNAIIKPTSVKGILSNPRQEGATPTHNVISFSNSVDSRGTQSRVYNDHIYPVSQNTGTNAPAESILGSLIVGEVTSTPNIAHPSNCSDFHGTPSKVFDARATPSIQKAHTRPASPKGRFSSLNLEAATPDPNTISPSNSNDSRAAPSRSYDAHITRSSEHISSRRNSSKDKLDSPTMMEAAPAPNIKPPSNADCFPGTPSRAYEAHVTRSSEHISSRRSSSKDKFDSPPMMAAAPAPYIKPPSYSDDFPGTPSRAYDAHVTRSSEHISSRRSSSKDKLDSPTMMEAAPAPNIKAPSNAGCFPGTPSRAYDAHVTRSSEYTSSRRSSSKDKLDSPPMMEAAPVPNIKPPSYSDDFPGTPSRSYEAHVTRSSEHISSRRSSSKDKLDSPPMMEAAPAPNIKQPSNSDCLRGTPSRAYDAHVTRSSENTSSRRSSSKDKLDSPPMMEAVPAPNIKPPSYSDDFPGTPSRSYDAHVTRSPEYTSSRRSSSKDKLDSPTMMEAAPAPYIKPPSNSDCLPGTPSRAYDAHVTRSSEHTSSRRSSSKDKLDSPPMMEAAPAPYIKPPSYSDDFPGTPSRAYDVVMPSIQTARTSCTPKKRIICSSAKGETTPPPNITPPSDSKVSDTTPSRAYDAPFTLLSQNASTKYPFVEDILSSPALEETAPAPTIGGPRNCDDFHGTPRRTDEAPMTSALQNVSTRSTPDENLLRRPVLKVPAPGPNAITPSNTKFPDRTPSKAYDASLTSLFPNAGTKPTSAEGILGSPALEESAPATDIGPSSNYDKFRGTPSRTSQISVESALEIISTRRTPEEYSLTGSTRGEDTFTPRISPVYNFNNLNGAPTTEPLTRATTAMENLHSTPTTEPRATTAVEYHHSTPTTEPLTRATTAAEDEQRKLLLESSQECNSILHAIQQQTEIHNQHMSSVCSWLEKIASAVCADNSRSSEGGAAQVIGQMQETLAFTNNVMQEIRDHLKTTQPALVLARTRPRTSSPRSSDSESPESEERPLTASDYSSSNESVSTVNRNGQRSYGSLTKKGRK